MRAGAEEKKIPTVPVLAVVHEDGVVGIRSLDPLQRDLFVKPVDGKGGRGTERWDYLGEGRHRSGDGREHRHKRDADFDRCGIMGWPRIMQRASADHSDLLPLNDDALATVRALTCLDETGHPELLGAVLRMAVGSNHVVDNLHAGGIAAAVDLATGRLGMASNLGMDCALGWLDRHPQFGRFDRRLPAAGLG